MPSQINGGNNFSNWCGNFGYLYGRKRVSLVAQTVKNLPVMQEIRIAPLGQEDALEKGMATISSILAWRIPWTEEPLWATVHGVTKSWTQLSD